MSDSKTVELLSRYKPAKKAAQEYIGTHLEQSPKYPSFYSGRGLEPRHASNSVGFLLEPEKDEKPEAGVDDERTPYNYKVPPFGRFHRKSGIAMVQVENEVGQSFATSGAVRIVIAAQCFRRPRIFPSSKFH